MEIATVRLSDFGSTFATRQKAQTIGVTLKASVSTRHDSLVVDFSGVRAVSYSFADELLTQILEATVRTERHMAKLSNCSEEILGVFTSGRQTRERLNEHHMRAAEVSRGLRFSSTT